MSDPKSCPVCMNPYSESGARVPRSLACGHTLCTSCLRQQLQLSATNNSINCAECRAPHVLAVAEAAPKAFALINLLFGDNDDHDANDAAVPIDRANAPAVHEDALGVAVAAEHDDVLITLTPPAGVRRTALDAACVIDISGSMGTDAKMKNESGVSESHGLSLLDIVKHAVTTIANVLGPDDRLSIVAYSSLSKIVIPLTSMDALGQKLAVTEVGLLYPDDMTNMFAGIKDGVEELARGSKGTGRAAHVFVLTDGQPNVEPARGHLKALEALCTSLEWRCTLSTFGFGYNIDTALLRSLAVMTGGNYVFIPDSSFVGTAFVNAVAHALTTVAQQTRVTVVPKNGAKIVDAERDQIGGHQVVSRSGDAVQLAIGVVAADVPRHVVVRMKLPPVDTKQPEAPYCEVTVDYNATTRGSNGNTAVQRTALGYLRSGGDSVRAQALRIDFIDTLVKLVPQVSGDATLAPARATLAQLGTRLESLGSNALVEGLIGDLKGQIAEAFQRFDWFSRWGKHYVQSLSRSHELEVCANFKDVGLQRYAGKLFEQLQAAGDEIFCTLPAPKPAPPPASVLKAMNMSAATWQAQAAAPSVSMANYHDSSGTCFAPTALVRMADGTTRAAGDVKRGDLVRTLQRDGTDVGGVSRVQCVVRSVATPRKQFDLVTLPSGLVLTPFHPVHVGGRWQFPINVAGARLAHSVAHCPAVVSFLLADRAPAMQIDNTAAITLAHGIDDDAVARHAFFGSERVVSALAQLDGFNDGLVELRAGECLERDPQSGLIVGLFQ